MVNFLRLLTILAIVAGWLSGAPTAQAGFSLITTRAGTDTFDWGQLGAEVSFVTPPQSVTSVGGVLGSVGVTGDPIFLRVDQTTGFAGNFAPDDKLLLGWVNIGPITITTGALNSRIGGVQIQTVHRGDGYTAQVEALDTNGLVLATFTERLFSESGVADNSAAFIGISSTGSDSFNALRFSTDDANFAINQFSFTPADAPQATATPLPHTLVAALLGVFSLCGTSLRRRGLALRV